MLKEKRNLKQSKIFLLVLVLIFLISFANVGNAYSLTILDNLYIEHISQDIFYKDMNIYPSEKFFKMDKEHIKNLTEVELKDEVFELFILLDDIKSDYEIVNNVKIYHPLVTEKINSINGAIYNRDLLAEHISDGKDTSSYIYKTNLYFSDYYFPYYKIAKKHDIKDSTRNYYIAKELLKNLDINDIFLKDLTMFIAPWSFNDIDGFAEFNDYGKGKVKNKNIHIPIAYYDHGPMKKEYFESVILHEMGHIVDAILTSNIEEFKNEYLSFYPKLNMSDFNNDSISWKNDPSENFAEDFKVYMGKKLSLNNDYVRIKDTNFNYNNKINEFFDKYLFKNIILVP